MCTGTDPCLSCSWFEVPIEHQKWRVLWINLVWPRSVINPVILFCVSSIWIHGQNKSIPRPINAVIEYRFTFPATYGFFVFRFYLFRRCFHSRFNRFFERGNIIVILWPNGLECYHILRTLFASPRSCSSSVSLSSGVESELSDWATSYPSGISSKTSCGIPR